MTVEEELLKLLEDDAALKLVNGDRVYYQEAKQDDMNTYIVFNTSDIPVRTKDGIAGWDLTALIVCYAKQNSKAVQMQEAVINAIEGYSSELIYSIDVTEKNQQKNQETNIYQREITAVIEAKK